MQKRRTFGYFSVSSEDNFFSLEKRANPPKRRHMVDTTAYVSVDIWTNLQMRSFIGFTVHFVDNEFNLKSRLLCCEHFAERHTAVNIANKYEDFVKIYQIDGKVRRVINDNASSMKKAYRL